MSDKFEAFKARHPELNWEEAEEIDGEDLVAAAEIFDRIVDEIKKGKQDGTNFSRSQSEIDRQERERLEHSRHCVKGNEGQENSERKDQ